MAQFILMLTVLINWVMTVYYWVLLAGIIVSWVAPYSDNIVFVYIRKFTDPVFNFARKMLPFLAMGTVDFSPIVVFIAYTFIQIGFVRIMVGLARLFV